MAGGRMSGLTRKVSIGLIGLGVGLGGCASQEVYLEQGKVRDGEKPVLVSGVDGFMDTFLSEDLHALGYDINRNFNVAVVVNSVDFEGRNMRRIREAHKNGYNIALACYSMGCERTLNLANQCDREGIPIELVVMYDPTCANSLIYLPENVKKVAAYFSTSANDPMAWARGNPGNIKSKKVVNITIKRKPGAHIGFVNRENMIPDLKPLIEECKKGEVVVAKRR